uniref:Uncharacterized protein n=1 Tax=Ovis aries TaxID=9940 RepID=A0AC11D4T1_SHEEP
CAVVRSQACGKFQQRGKRFLRHGRRRRWQTASLGRGDEASSTQRSGGPGIRPGSSNPIYAEYIMRNSGLDEAQAGIKIAGRNINNLRYADDTTLMAEGEEE